MPFSRLYRIQLQMEPYCFYRFSWFLFWHNQICILLVFIDCDAACAQAHVVLQAFIRLHRGWKWMCKCASRHSYGLDHVYVWVCYTKSPFLTRVTAAAAATTTTTALDWFPFAFCHMFPDREFNSIYKFYAFITINPSTINATNPLRSRHHVPSLMSLDLIVTFLSFLRLLYTFDRIKHDKTV